jgi:hypothetical protein
MFTLGRKGLFGQLPARIRVIACTDCGKTCDLGVLKAHGFLAVPYVFENDLQRGSKPRPSRLPLPVLRFFRMLCKPSSSTVAGEWCVENMH